MSAEAIATYDVSATGIDQMVSLLSGGNRQKVAFAKWLATKPRVLILDEPTHGIDVGSKAQVHRIIAEPRRRGLAILMISSDLPEVLAMSDRILVIAEGELVAEIDAGHGDAGGGDDGGDRATPASRPMPADGALAAAASPRGFGRLALRLRVSGVLAFLIAARRGLRRAVAAVPDRRRTSAPSSPTPRSSRSSPRRRRWC